MASSPRKDYREFYLDEAGRSGFRFPDRDLLKILKSDSDPFVRASLYLNSALWNSEIASSWPDATHLERLAMVRRTAFGMDFLLVKIFDLKNNELGLSVDERTELIWAFLSGLDETNKTFRNSYGERDSYGEGGGHSPGGRLWKLISEWSEQTDLKALVYRFLPADYEDAAEVYRISQKPELRRIILSMAWAEHRDKNSYFEKSPLMVGLGSRDADGGCRSLAYGMLHVKRARYRVWGFQERVARWQEFRKVKREARNDLYALGGLAKNLSLSPRELGRQASALFRSKRMPLYQEGGLTDWGELLTNIERDYQRTIRELRFERELNKRKSARNPENDEESKAEWTQDDKLDYLMGLAFSNPWSSSFLGVSGVASALGLVLSGVTYFTSHNLPLSLLVFFFCFWLGGFLFYLAVKYTYTVPPWQSFDAWTERWEYLWSPFPRKPPISGAGISQGAPNRPTN